MKKVFGILLLLVVSGMIVSAPVNTAGMWHDASDVGVTINGFTMSLQEAADGHYVAGSGLPSANGVAKDYAHNASDILITIDGFTMTLQHAIDINAFTFGATADGPVTTGLHTADEISIIVNSVSIDLESAIENGDIKCQAKTCADYGYGSGFSDGCGGSFDCIPPSTYSWHIGPWLSNNACPTMTFTKSVYCIRNDGANMGTTCGVYAGCECPKPTASTTRPCNWDLTSLPCTSSNDYLAKDSGGCEQWITKTKTSCNTFGAIVYCAAGMCGCGTSCDHHHAVKLRCAVDLP